MTKKSRQKLNYLENEGFFIIFKGFSTVKNCLRPESAPLDLIKLCSPCVKQNTVVKTASDACSLLPK